MKINDAKNIFNSINVEEKITKFSTLNGGLENDKYLIDLENGLRLLVKIYRVADKELIHNELLVLQNLSENGIFVQKPFMPHGKPIIFEFSEKIGTFFHFIEGNEPNQNIPNIYSIGQIMGQINSVKPPVFLRKNYKYNLSKITDFVFNNDLPTDVSLYFKKSINISSNIDFSSVSYGICHCDIFLDNLIHNIDGSIYVIDFEEVAYESIIFELGRAALGCCSKSGDISDELFQYLIEGYTKQKQLTKIDLDSLPAGIVYATLVSTFWRYYTFEIEKVNPKLTGSYKALMKVGSSYIERKFS